MGFFNFLIDFFDDIKDKLLSIGKSVDRKKLETIGKQVKAVTDFVLPVAQMVTMLTPTTIDDTIVAALSRLNMTIPQILEETNEAVQDGMKLALTAELARQKLIDELKANPGKKIKIGNIVVSSVEEALGLNKNLFRTAAQDIFLIIKGGTK